MKHKPLPTQERLHYLFYYNPETGAFYGRFKQGAGKIGHRGYIEASGRRTRWVDKVRFKEARLIWMYATGEDAGDLEVEHKDRGKTNNRLSNLRLATRSENMRNLPYVGATWHKNVKKWIARIRVNGTPIHLGSFKDKDEAIACYKEARVKYFGEFA